MKRIPFNHGRALVALAVLCAVGSPMSARAQGTVLFQNDERGLVYQWGTLCDPTPVLTGFDNRPHIQIAYAPAGTSLTPWRYVPAGANSISEWLARNPGWTGGPTANLIAPGRFDGGTVSMEGVSPGKQADYVIFGWNIGLNFDYGASLGIGFGYAGPFRTATGGGGAPPVPLADSFMGITIVGSMNPECPEPSSAALLIFGVGTVLALRARRV